MIEGVRLVLSVLAAAVLGCGGAPEDAREVLACAPRAGAYRVSYVLLDGNCGEFTAQTHVIDDTTQPTDRGCTGELIPSADGCAVEYRKADCGGVAWSGTIAWDTGATRGTGQMVHEVEMPGYTCRGTYDVTYSNADDATEPKT